MQYSTLGNSSLKISKIGFGCMSLQNNRTENEHIIGKALEGGVNYFDTADLYENGANESKIGSLLKAVRDKVILATKVGNQYRADGNGWDWNPRKEYILQAVNGSLKRLQTDYIDLYQLHGGTIDDPIDETIEAFEILKAQGKIRYYGISSIRPNVIREYVRRANIVSVMMQYSLLDRRPEETCFDLLEKHNIGVLSRGSLAQGLLVDKPARPYLNWSAAEVEHAANMIKEITGETDKRAQAAIRFALYRQIVKSAVIGVRTLSQLEDSLPAADFPSLSAEEITRLSAALPVKYYQEHR